MQLSQPQQQPGQKAEPPLRIQYPFSRMTLLTRRFVRDQRGSTAIEFVALALPFSLLVFAILESCLSFAGQEVLANATDDIARQLRTGQLRPVTKDKITGVEFTVDETYLKNEICERLSVIAPGNCFTNLKIDLREFDTFAEAAALRVKITNGEIDTSGFEVELGNSGTKNILRTFYPWPVITDLMSSSMSNLNGNKTLHFATTTWQNEPFDD